MCRSPWCASTQRIPAEPHCIPFPANQVFHAFNSLLIAIYVTVVRVLNSLTPGPVSTHVIALAGHVRAVFPHRLCPTEQGKWQIRIESFAWFIRALTSEFTEQ